MKRHFSEAKGSTESFASSRRRPLSAGEKRDIEAGLREAQDPSKCTSYPDFESFLKSLD